MESLGGLNDVSEKDEMKEEKVVNLNEEKKKRKPFWYWTVKDRDYRLKLKASTNWQAGEQVSPEYYEPGGRHALPVGHADYYSGGYGALGAWN